MASAKGFSPYLLAGVGIAGISILSMKNNREKVYSTFSAVKQKTMEFWCRTKPEACDDLIHKAGHPDPYDTGDNNMVDEGAMYSINYYNQTQ